MSRARSESLNDPRTIRDAAAKVVTACEADVIAAAKAVECHDSWHGRVERIARLCTAVRALKAADADFTRAIRVLEPVGGGA